MKKILLLLFILFNLSANADFGIWASGVYLNTNGSSQFYAALLQNDPNSIGTANFNGSLGSYVENSGTFTLRGAEIKTFKNNGGNVCGGVMYYTVYPQGARPASPVFSPINLNFLCNCSGGTFNSCGGGACTDNSDQKWQTIDQTIDLTQNTVGTYTIEVYFQIPGSATSGACDETSYDSNGGFNYTADFTITTNLAVNFSGLSASLVNDQVKLKWSIENDVDITKYEIERSANGIDFTKLSSVTSVQSAILYNYAVLDNAPFVGVNFYRVKFYKTDNSISYSKIFRIDFSKISSPLKVVSNQSAGTISVQMNHIPKGKYNLIIVNNLGQRMANYPVIHDGVDKTLPVNIQSKLNMGVYRLLLTCDGQNYRVSFFVK